MSHFPHIFRRQTHADTGSVKGKKDKSGSISLAPAATPAAPSRGPAPTRLSPLRTTAPLDQSHSQLNDFGVRRTGSPASLMHQHLPEQGGSGSGPGPSSSAQPTGSRTPYAASTYSFGEPSREGSIYTMAGRSDRTHRADKADKASIYTAETASMRTHRRDGSASPKSRRSPGSSPSASLNASPSVPDASRLPRASPRLDLGLGAEFGGDEVPPDVLPQMPNKQERGQCGPDGGADQMYPGVVMGAFAGGVDGGLGFGPDTVELNDMDGILDPSASAARMDGHGRQGSAAGANIAPWLSDDAAKSPPPSTPVDRSGANTPFGRSTTNLAHSTSMTSIPARMAMTRSTTGLSMKDDARSIASSRSGSHADVYNTLQTRDSSGSSRETSQTRHQSSESVNTLSAMPQINTSSTKRRQPSEVYNGGRTAAPSRYSRMSLASSTGSAKEKKGIFGLLKRKGTGVPADFGPAVGPHRTSMSGSNSSRMSAGTSYSGPTFSEPSPTDTGPSSRRPSMLSDGMISPLSEIGEFHLDMNLDDMEGIVDPTLANAPPTAPYAGSNTSASSGLNENRLRQSFATTSSAGADSIATSSGTDSRSSRPPEMGSADGLAFSRVNPFSNSPTSSIDGRLSFSMATPPSPQNMSPKHTLAAVAAHPIMNQPRRPSQLRNVKLGSWDDNASDSTDAVSQPLSPTWMASPSGGKTVFNDPFGSGGPKKLVDGVPPSAVPDSARLPPLRGSDGSEASRPSPLVAAPAIAPAGAAAWAAPESWGVEGDEEEEEPAGEASSSSGEEVEEDSWVEPTEEESRKGSDQSRSGQGSLGSRRSSGQVSTGTQIPPPPFGHKSLRGRPGTASGRRPKTAQGRAEKASRRERPVTSGSIHNSAVPHWIRIYRADGTFAVMAFQLTTSTSEIINVLSGANEAPAGKKVTTSMKLYLRERGQDRMLQPSERPLLIQDRRLRQAGFTDRENPEEIGKEDLAILCKFIYQTPVLPVMDPEEENQYDSFEFIDIAGRDLQTIPIFLHLHAHNIIILNISRNPMTDIPLDFIQACTSLKEIRMSNMALKRLPPSIRASTSLARVDVSSNRIAELDSVPLNEIATLLSLKVQNNKLTSIPTYFAQMKSLKYLNISNNKFEAFPEVVCEMSNLVDLDVSFNNISSLPSKMSDLRSLEKLAVFGNELSSFPSSFSNLANLRDLDVRRNNLTDLNAVYALPNLTRLQADWNNIVTLDAQLGAKVKAFSVQHNSITRFTLAPLPGATAVTYSLTHLNLSHAKISTLADEAFSGLVNLVDLNLNFNQFTQLPSTLGRLTNLETLSCTDNLLNDLPIGWGKMTKLRVLNLHNNNLRQLPAELWLCPVESLNLSSNLLQHFDDLSDEILSASATREDLQGLRKESIVSQSSDTGPGSAAIAIPPAGLTMRRLYLADNQINDDIFHHIARMPNLQILNLSFNDIYEVPHGTLSHNTMLEALYLSGNKLTSLPSEDLEQLQRLKILHLNGNKLQTLPSELGAIKTLQHLDVGSNVLKYNIANWPYDWNWNWNTALRYLNLSGNKRLEIKPTSGQDMSSSFRKELSDFTALNQLRVLGLMDVTLRIPSLPDESDEKRVRTSFAEVNDMRYGISDMLGTNDTLALFDLVAPNFRGRSNECVFGLFGRSAPSIPSGRVPKFLQESFVDMLQSQLDRLKPDEAIMDALRRSFLMENRKAFEFLMGSAKNRKESTASFGSVDSMFQNWQPNPISTFRTGAAGTIVYLVDRTLYIATIGAHSVVLSRKGEAELMTSKHDPTEREETARVRKAEGWVSPKGLINEDKDLSISRAFGYWQHFPVVNASPEVRERHLTEADEFVIIASHSLWKCCSYQTAVDIARTERDDPMMAAQKLRDFAISYGAEGSVMVMVINISDLMYGRGQRRAYATGGPSTGPNVDPETAGDYMQGVARRNMRRRYEEVGDRTLNRLQQEIEPPTGQVAIVFTDIVNSTVLWETNPGMPSSIKIHHNLFRRQLRLDGGYEVKTEGDAFMVSFQTVISALLWCFNCQIMLLQQEWPRELLEAKDGKVVYDSEGNIVQRGLRVRMGIHWGNPQCEKDPITRRMDYYGPMVNRAARIQASADGGQLMASQDVINELQAIQEYVESIDTEDEANADMPPELKREVQELKRIGLEVKEMGERKLKGLEVPEKLHLLYPKVLSGRFEISSNINSNVEVQPTPLYHAPRHIDIEDVRRLVMLCLRLESVASGAVAAFARAAVAESENRRTPPGSPGSPRGLGSPRLSQSHAISPSLQHPRSPISPRSPRIHVSDELANQRLSIVQSHSMPLGAPLSPVMSASATLRQASYSGREDTDGIVGALIAHNALRRQNTAPPPGAMLLPLGTVSETPHANSLQLSIPLPQPAMELGPLITDDMTDDELLVIIESLITRLENSMSRIFVKQLGGMPNILSLLQQALSGSSANPGSGSGTSAEPAVSLLGQVMAMVNASRAP